MKPTLPICCSPAAYQLIARQAATLDASDALVYGAVAIAMHKLEDVDPSAVDAILQHYADTVRNRVRGTQPQALLAHLHEFLFEEEGFAGDQLDYYQMANSFLPTVLERKRGLPIILSLIYKTVAEKLGLRAWGVGLPGHFLVGLEIDGQSTLIDPFAGGRIITRDEAHDRLKELVDPDMEWSEELVRPASNRQWLTRILQNLLNLYANAGHFSDVAAVLEMEMLLWPEQAHLQRDLGLVLARCGFSEPASVWLDRYVRTNPNDPQTGQIKQLLHVLTD